MMLNHKHLFVGGLHRSGTWLLVRFLKNHPEVSHVGGDSEFEAEGQFLQSVYPTDQFYGGVGLLGFHPEAHLTESSDLLTDNNRAKLVTEWSSHWDLSKPCLMEKTPANILRSRFLQEVFPDSYFIFLMRHPIAVALAQQKWTGLSISTLIEHWLVCYETLQSDIAHLNKSMLIKYENFVSNPDETITDITKFLELSQHHNQQNVIKTANERYLSIWRKFSSLIPTKPSLLRRIVLKNMPRLLSNGYPVMLLENEIKSCVLQFESRVNTFGYSLIDS